MHTLKGNSEMDILVCLNVSIFNVGYDINLDIFMCRFNDCSS